MTLYFAWVDPQEDYDSYGHARHDEDIFDLEISQKEGGFAWAQITCANPFIGILNPARHSHCFISYGNKEGVHLLFKGRILGMPTKIKGDLVQMRFTAEPLDQQQKLKALCDSLKTTEGWDPLFVEPQHRDDPLEVLEARSDLFYWSRTAGTVELSNIFQGAHTLNLSDNFFYDSLQVEVGPPPLEAVRVQLVAEWTQSFAGEVDLSPLIAAQFPESIINTLTGADLQAKWWKTGDYIAFPGYYILESFLEEIVPPRTGSLNLYPRYSPLFWTGSEGKEEAPDSSSEARERQRIRFKRTWFRSCLRLGWRYHQRRKETAFFTLYHKTQPVSSHNRRQRTLTLFLQDIVGEHHFWRPHCAYHRYARIIHEGVIYRCRQTHISGSIFEADNWERLSHCQHVSEQASRATFFLTDRGRQAIAHGLEIARAHLALSARMITIKCEASFDSLFNVTTNCSLLLSDQRLPGRQVQGKVIAYRLCMEGQTGRRYVQVTIGVAVGAGRSSQEILPSSEEAFYVQANYSAGEAPSCASLPENKTTSGIVYKLDYDSLPTVGLLNPATLTAREIVQDLNISYHAAHQIGHLYRQQYPGRYSLPQALQEIPTNITLRLLDLTPLEVLHHTLNVQVPYAWSAPQQINLAAGSLL